jgi:molybdenum cofactor sulfurtransferase
VFTSGATASIKLVGESFDWNGSDRQGGSNGEYRYLNEAHTSLVGLRDIAVEKGATSKSFSVQEFEAGTVGLEQDIMSGRRRLFGMPLQCNATGRKFDLEAICKLNSKDRATETFLLLDAAAYLSAHQTLDLSQLPYDSAPDFIAFSFYKIFGFPTGLGGLVVKRSAIDALSRKTYFGGGTVDAVTPDKTWRVPKKDFIARMEDGTVNFHAILAIPCGIEVYDQLFGTEEGRKQHVIGLARRLVEGCGRLKHGNGHAVCRIYSTSRDLETWLETAQSDDRTLPRQYIGDQGATIAFNLLTSNGTLVPPNEVDRLACIQNIHLRTGRHCNAGVVTSQLGVTEEELIQQYRSGMGCDESANGSVVSASVRVSLNVANTWADVDRFIDFINRFFVQKQFSKPATVRDHAARKQRDGSYTLKQLIVYPIKSCAGQQIQPGAKWPLTPQGLKHDREWVLVDTKTKKALSQKKHHKMALIRSIIDLKAEILTVIFGGMEFQVSMSTTSTSTSATERHENIVVCGETAEPIVHQDPLLNQLLSEFLGLSCALARQPLSTRHSKLTGAGMQQQAMDRIPLLLSNESPFLLINQESVDAVSTWMKGHPHSGKQAVDRAKPTSFRGNFTIEPAMTTTVPRPFIEDDIQQIVIGPHVFSALGQCRRCQMVAIDQETGEHAPKTFLTLAKHRRNDRGRIIFGTHLTWRRDLEGDSNLSTEQSSVQVGMPVQLHFL